jgi:hypothetical protein
MNSTSSDNALQALHHALIRTRYLAYTGTDAQQIARILDDVEYLKTIILRHKPGYEDNFRLHLQGIEQKFAGFNVLVQFYDESQSIPVSVG